MNHTIENTLAIVGAGIAGYWTIWSVAWLLAHH